MKGVIYPLSFHQRFERRWATRLARDEPLRSPDRGTNICTCGEVVVAPVHSSYPPARSINGSAPRADHFPVPAGLSFYEHRPKLD